MRAYHEDAGRPAHEGPDPGRRARHEPGQRAPRRVPGGARCPSDARGLVDVERAASRSSTTRSPASCSRTRTRSGCSRRRSRRSRAIVHDVGGLVYYDGANLNAILGRVPARRHGLRHRAHQHAQDVRDAARRGRTGRRAGRGGRASWCRSSRSPRRRARRRDRGVPAATRTARDRSAGCTASTATSACSCARTLYVFLHGADGLEGGQRARGAERELPRGARSPSDFPLAFPDGRPMHEFVATATPLEGRDRDPRDGRREAADRPRATTRPRSTSRSSWTRR